MIKIITKSELQKKLQPEEIIKAVERAFIAYSKGNVLMPPPLVYAFPDGTGEICIKTAFSRELPTYTIKQVSVMLQNLKHGLPTLNATMNVYRQDTGRLAVVISEEGWLTNMRTAAAGAIAEKLFRKKRAKVLGIIGSGTQAEFQIRMILGQYKYEKVLIWNRTQSRAEELVKNIQRAQLAGSLQELLNQSDTVLMATAAREPIITPEMFLQKAVTLISVGSDMPEKCEIDPRLYKKADLVAVDSIMSNEVLGCISWALRKKLITKKEILEVGTVLSNKKFLRRNDQQFIIVNLVGIGAQDSYVGNLVYKNV